MQRVGQTFSNQFFNFILALNAAMAKMNRGGSREQMKKRPTATHAARSPSESQRLGTESRARNVRSGCTRGAWWIHLCWMQAHMVQSSLTVSSQSVSLHARHRVRRCWIRQGAQKHLSRESCNRTGFKTPYILGRYVQTSLQSSIQPAPTHMADVSAKRINSSPLLHQYCTIIQESNT